jgi:hypothetical protein
MVATKSFWKNLIFSNESCMVNFKPILNTLEMDVQEGLWFAGFGPL